MFYVFVRHRDEYVAAISGTKNWLNPHTEETIFETEDWNLARERMIEERRQRPIPQFIIDMDLKYEGYER